MSLQFVNKPNSDADLISAFLKTNGAQHCVPNVASGIESSKMFRRDFTARRREWKKEAKEAKSS